MTLEVPTPVIDSIACILDQWAGGSSEWRCFPSIAAKDQMTSYLRDDLAANGLSWDDAKPFILGMNKALALMEHFTGHPDGYRSVVMTVDLLKEKGAEPRPPTLEVNFEPPPN